MGRSVGRTEAMKGIDPEDERRLKESLGEICGLLVSGPTPIEAALTVVLVRTGEEQAGVSDMASVSAVSLGGETLDQRRLLLLGLVKSLEETARQIEAKLAADGGSPLAVMGGKR